MSWVEFLGENWPVTAHDLELHLHLWPPLAQCPRQGWSLALHHYDFLSEENPRQMRRYLNFEIGNLHCATADWRRLAGLEIRADAAWHAAHEHFHEYGRLESAEAEARVVYVGNTPENPRPDGEHQTWQGHDFLLRLGARDGLIFPCELDAWLLPEEEYYRTRPETAAELARFGEGPPDLRIIARAVFTRATVCVPRTADPVAFALETLRAEIGLDECHDPRLTWASRRTRDGKGVEHMPGWTSTVTVCTQPAAVPQGRSA